MKHHWDVQRPQHRPSSALAFVSLQFEFLLNGKLTEAFAGCLDTEVVSLFKVNILSRCHKLLTNSALPENPRLVAQRFQMRSGVLIKISSAGEKGSSIRG